MDGPRGVTSRGACKAPATLVVLARATSFRLMLGFQLALSYRCYSKRATRRLDSVANRPAWFSAIGLRLSRALSARSAMG